MTRRDPWLPGPDSALYAAGQRAKKARGIQTAR